MKLVIMHYHFRTGGVTSVILQALSTLIFHRNIESITLITGESPSHDIETLVHKHTSLHVHVHPCIGYITTSDGDVSNIEQEIINLFVSYSTSNTIWWVHNHHLGKNPIFTKMLMKHIHLYKIPCILHIHDFPEDARFENMNFIHTYMPLFHAYENTEHSIFSVINTHDLAILQSSGVPAVLLPNIISNTNQDPTQASRHNIKTMLLKHTHPNEYLDELSSYTLFTYPVRCIRRKNVLEAGLLTRLYEYHYQTPCLFAITLAGTSESEHVYSNIVQSLFESQLFRGFFNVSTILHSLSLDFNALCSASDLIISTSTQEGFGFSYLNAVSWEVPLLARDIPISKDIAPLLQEYWPAHWYTEVRVPITLLSSKQMHVITEYYHNKIRSLATHYSSHTISHITSQIHAIYNKEYIDFSFLPVSIQYDLICNIDVHMNELAIHNTSLLSHMHQCIHCTNVSINATHKKQVMKKIQETYGEEAFLNIFTSLCTQVCEGNVIPTDDVEHIAMNIKTQFLEVSTLRALYDPLTS